MENSKRDIALVERRNQLLIQYKNGDKAAFNELIEQNIGLVKRVVNMFSPLLNLEKEEMESIGLFSLYQAIITFDLGKGANFGTYATNVIFRDIIKGRKHALRLKCKLLTSAKRMEDNVFDKQDQDSDLLFQDTLADSNANVIALIENQELKKKIRWALSYLSERDEEIVRLYYGIDCSIVKAENIAKIYHITPQRVYQILKDSNKKLKKALEKEYPKQKILLR